MTVRELLESAVRGRITEAQFMEEFSKLFRDTTTTIPDADSECLSALVEDVNIAEHVGTLFDSAFVWKVEECLRLLSSGTPAPEIRKFFATNRAP